ncbi:MAG TPA: SDR family oxidoreductase [Vitreimonas sp.]|nr:SDR family oxidoreductase [Vitreimonas sp.]
MPKLPLITTGLNGLVGSKLATDFEDKYDFVNLDRAHPTAPTDITDYSQVLQAFQDSAATHVVHFAAYTDVTGAWQQTGDKTSIAYQVNVVGTENIVKAAEATNKHIIHISTAYVFDGNKAAPYLETDPTSPIEWYGQTKVWAEEVVQKATVPWTILRIDQPFRSDEFPKLDAVHRIIAGLKQETLYPQFTNHFFGPTYIDDFVKVIDWVIRTNTEGLFHTTNNESWNDYDFASAINEALYLNKVVKKGDINEYLKSTQRPYQRNTALNCEKLIGQLDFKLHSIKEALAEVASTYAQ